MSLALDSCPALVLNADFRPLSYFPLSLWSWQETVKAVFLDRVNIISHYDRVVRSPSFEMKLPSVISLKEYIPTARRPAFTRFNVFLRDRFTCQYCGEDFPSHDLTFDHVVPRSRGGRTVWENVVTACSSCNLLKGNRLPQESSMYPRHLPCQPTTSLLQENGRAFPPNFLHQSWRDFLYWDTELEPS
ncbi:MAG TPA: HNH endonuclease [Stellaceae bacterium]|nr:HNH endonuclease [Stellaceae bacterium]